MAYEKTMSEGKESPALSSGMLGMGIEGNEGLD